MKSGCATRAPGWTRPLPCSRRRRKRSSGELPTANCQPQTANRKLKRDQPVVAEVDGQFLEQHVDDPRTVLIEEVDDCERPLLRMTVREGLRLRARELTPQRFVALLRRVNHLAVQR